MIREDEEKWIRDTTSGIPEFLRAPEPLYYSQSNL